MQVVWFKRDLRIVDHEALVRAVKAGPVIPIYILEPDLWAEPDMSGRQYEFLRECLNELDRSLKQLGQGLVIKVGDAVETLDRLYKAHSIDAIWSHQETWNGWTYERDKRVLNWCKTNKIIWHEPTQNGVIRRLKDRDGWSRRWYHQMKQPIIDPPEKLYPVDELSEPLPSSQELSLEPDLIEHRQKGGRELGIDLLYSFLHERGEGYTKEMSSPVTGFNSCSRLSAHLAFGTLSIREVFQACEQRNQELKESPRGTKGKWPSAFRSFSGRLRWHCHFIQKLEDEPRIEFENMHSAYNKLRTSGFNQAYFDAWKSGNTGYPMVDACMRALIATGWMNFRMRAMLMSFASYHLWLDWRKTALHLARMFTDYEPGIHYSQVQMQSGTTGINTVRIYNPIKQGVDQDPDGIFIRQWIAELREMGDRYIHTPWQAASQMNGYPMPIVDEKEARKAASDQLYGLRKNNPSHRAMAKQIVKKHGSRKPTRSPRKRDNKQGELPL